MEKILKKTFGVLFASVIVISSVLLSYAQSDQSLYPRCTAILTDPEGRQYSIKVDTIPQVKRASFDDSEAALEYTFTIENQYLTPLFAQPKFEGTQENTLWDETRSVKGSISIVYDERTANGRKEYLLKSVSGSWQKSDTSVSMTNKRVAYTCQDVINLDQIHARSITGNSFSFDTGYTAYVGNVVTGVLGANIHTDLIHPEQSGSWSLDVAANLFDNNILDYIPDFL